MSSRSLLTADARRALALHAGGDLSGVDAARAGKLADDCPDCRGHLADVRGGLEVLAECDAGACDSGLWPAVRDALPAVTPAADPPRASFAKRFAAPATALTAAAVLVGAFVAGPSGWGVDATAPVSVRGISAERFDLPAGTRMVRTRDGRLYYRFPDGRYVPAAAADAR